MATICVYCSSSDAIDDAYPRVARALGDGLARGGHDLIYGGGTVGLMGVVARAVRDGGGAVTGVIPDRLREREGVADDGADDGVDDLIVTETMSERKRVMFTRADAFVVLPGGFGTLEEFLEVLTLKQLGYHARPIVLLNTDGFFDPLLAFFQRLHEAHFARENVEQLVTVAPTPDDALDALSTRLPVDGAAG